MEDQAGAQLMQGTREDRQGFCLQISKGAKTAIYGRIKIEKIKGLKWDFCKEEITSSWGDQERIPEIYKDMVKGLVPRILK